MNIDATRAIAILDAGKTNKKVLVFDERYRVIDEHTSRMEEVTDEDGDSCEDVHALTRWIKQSVERVLGSTDYQVHALNFTSYGASFVHVNEQGLPFLPLYNYLKPFPPELLESFFNRYGGEELFCRETASPLLGHLNSGLLLYRLMHQKPEYQKTKYSLHLPQYLNYVVTGKCYSDITSIGCHTMLWNFETNAYHRWVAQEGLLNKLAPITASDFASPLNFGDRKIWTGVGLHDSSSALIPYLTAFHDPFILISTGTWSITLNSFNNVPLNAAELKQDCLCYLSYQGKPVKASRLFAGHMHEAGVKKLNQIFHKNDNYYSTVKLNAAMIDALKNLKPADVETGDFSQYENFEMAYHALVMDLVDKQIKSSNLVMNDVVKKLFVDGGFGKNEIYMQLLADAYPHLEVYAASVAQATALGAALAIHNKWNDSVLPDGLVELRKFSAGVAI